MAVGLIMEFEGIGREAYDAVTGLLGVDPETGGGGWPVGLEFHASGAKPGGWLVFEIWASREAQERYLNLRLGPALEKDGFPGRPARMEHVELVSALTPAGHEFETPR
jgi:hypothetical protein